MIAAGIGTILQSLKRGPVGSGYLCRNLVGPDLHARFNIGGEDRGIVIAFRDDLRRPEYSKLFYRDSCTNSVPY